jgi:HSP20 family molecular chaperone IbpA
MDAAKRRTTILGIVILTVWLPLGLALLFWAVKTSRANNPTRLWSDFQKPGLLVAQTDEWDPVRQMERMQEEIDRAIRNAAEQFRFGPGATVFAPQAGYSSSFDLRDRKDHYELRAYLPEVNASDVNVRIDNDRTLHVSVTQRKQQKKDTTNGSESFTELGQYEQVVTLPDRVNSKDMKIDRRGHEIIITIPKSSSTETNSI